MNDSSASVSSKFFIGTFLGGSTQPERAVPEPARAVVSVQTESRLTAASPASFAEVCRLYREERDAEFAARSRASDASARKASMEGRAPSEADEFVEWENRAIIGVPETVTAIMENIQSFVDRHRLHDTALPEYYRGLPAYAREEQRRYSEVTHAVFHEVYGFKALACWLKYPNSYAAQIIGTSIWIHTDGRHQRMPFQFASTRDVDKIIRALTRHKDDAVVNLYRTALEVDLYTGERVTLTVKPDVRHDVITLRRFLIGRVTVAMLAEPSRGTIPPEAIPLIRGLSKTHCNTLIVGAPGTGKSTTLKALLAEREDHYTGAVIEKHYELAASRDFPEKKLIERITHENTFHHAMDQVLRFDVDYAIIGEVRRVEAEGAMLACERLLKGFGSTFHTWKPETIPAQFARLLCNLNAGARFEEEEKRVADNIDIVIVQTQDASRRRKRFKSVMELRYDRQTGEIRTHEIMRYDPDADKWRYRFDLSERLVREMREMDPVWADTVIRTLQELERSSPIPEGEGINVYNPAERNPLFRIQAQLERMNRELAEVVEAVERIAAGGGSGRVPGD